MWTRFGTYFDVCILKATFEKLSSTILLVDLAGSEKFDKTPDHEWGAHGSWIPSKEAVAKQERQKEATPMLKLT